LDLRAKEKSHEIAKKNLKSLDLGICPQYGDLLANHGKPTMLQDWNPAESQYLMINESRSESALAICPSQKIASLVFESP
jgi:hypothetical protein